MIPQDITDGNPKNLLIIKLLQTGPLLLKEKLWYSLRFCKPGFLPVLSPVVVLPKESPASQIVSPLLSQIHSSCPDFVVLAF